MELIKLNHVSKSYRVHVQDKSSGSFLRRLFRPELKTVHAVSGLSFSIRAGELVGFIGENGAGKSTTIKMMSGILSPDEGEIRVNGLVPYQKRRENAANIGVVFGQRTRLQWDLPMKDSFDLYREIYRIDPQTYRKNVDQFVEMLHMESFLTTPVRQLSLGQRMKVEITLSLLHDPPILYLDEPTIGLDVFAKHQIRDFIRQRNRTGNTTTILTSHDMKDLEEVCRRIILLSQGRLLFDGTMGEFRNRYAAEEVLEVVFSSPVLLDHTLLPGCRIVQEEPHKAKIAFVPQTLPASALISALAARYEISDVSIQRADIEDMVRGIYQEQLAH